MGRGVIVSHLGDAHYRIGLDIDVSYARNQLAAIQTYLDEFAAKYQEATEAKDAAKAALTPINDRLTDYLAAGQAASQAAYDAMVAAYEEYITALQDQPDPSLLASLRDIMSDAQGLIISTGDDLVDNMLAPDDETGYTVYRVLTPFEVSSSDSSNTISAKDHGYSNDEVVLFEEWSEDVGLTLDACDPLLEPVNKYYIVNATTSAFEVSLTPGGDPVPLLPPYTEEQEIWGNDKELDVDTSGSRLLQKNTDVVDGDKVRFSDFSDDLGIALDVAHYVVNANERDFRVSLTPGGTPLTWPDAETVVEQIGWTDFSAKLANFGSMIQDEAHGLANGTRVQFSAFADSAPLGTPAEAAKSAMSSASSSVTSRRNDLLANLEIYGTDRLYSLWTTVNCYLSNDGQYVIRNNHKLANGTRLQFSPFINPNDGSTYNTGLISGADYYVVQARENDFRVSTTPGGFPETMTTHTGARRQSDMSWENPDAGDYDKLLTAIANLESAQTTWQTLANPTSNLGTIAAKAAMRDNRLAQAMAALDAFLVDFSQPHYDAMLAAWETYQDARGDWVSAVEDGVPVEPIETGIVIGDEYFVINADADTYQITTTLGGAPVEIVEKWPRAQFYLRNSGSLCYKKDHGLTENQPVRWLPFFDDSFVTFDTGIVPGTVYYAVNVTTDEFQLAETSSGTPIAITEQAGGAMRSSTMFYRDETYVSSPRDADGQWYDETEETVFVPRYAIMSVFDRIDIITTGRTGTARHLNETGDIDTWTAAIPPAGFAEVDWYGLIAASVVENEASILAAQDSMLDGRAQYEGAYNQYVTAFLADDPNTNDYRIAALSWKEEYETRLSDWLALVDENSGDSLLAARLKEYESATEAFNQARQDLGKLLNNGGLPEELAAILADQEKAYADYHAALANWADMTLIKTEKEKLFAELNGRLLPYFESNIEGLVETSQPKRQEVNAWCCDYTEDLSPGAEVATIEIPGERDLAVRVRPGYESRETYSAERDGLLQPSWASSPEATYWNWALHPGNARWNPNYRLGEILLIDAQAGTCTVQLDQQTNNAKSRARDGNVLDVNNPIKYQIDPDTGEQTVIMPGDNVQVDSGITTLTDVTIEYMECNADAFEVGDHVMVEFQGRDWTQPKVIGFAESPRPCFVHGVALVGITGEGNQDGVLIPTHAHGVTPRLRHPAGVVNGGNIDWTSTDGKTVLTYNGPRGRLIAQRLEVPFIRIKGPNEYIARTYDAETQNFATDTLMTQPFGRVMYLNGKLAGTAPEDRNLLGGALLTHTAGGVTTRWLVAAMTGRYWSTTDYVASMQTYRDTITPNNAGRAVNPFLKLHVLAYAKYTGAAIAETGWTVLDSQDFADDFSILPPLHNYFFSGSGAKFITLIPTVTRNGIGNPTIRRGTLGWDANSVWLESDAITAQERVPGMRTYIQQDVQTYTTGTSFTSISATCQEQAIVAADFIGEEEVTLEVTASEFTDYTSNGSNTAWYDDLLTSSSSSSGSSSITWTLTDTHRNQTVGSMSASTSYGSNENYAWDGGYSSSFYSTSDGSLEQPLFYDLRNGASIVETSSTNYARNNDVSIIFGSTSTGTATASFLRTVSQSLRDHLGTTLWQDSQSFSDGYSEDNPEPPLMAPGVSADEFTVTDYYGVSAHRWASMHWWVDDYTGFGDPLWVAPVYYIQPTNAEGDSVLRMDIGFYPSFGGYEIFPDESRIMLRFPDSTLFTRFEPRSINMAIATGFDLSQAWQDHLRDKHPNEEENYPDAVTSNLTPYFKV